MTTATDRTEPDPARPHGDGDVVISIDAMGGDRGVADVLRGMGKALELNPRLRYIVHGDAAALERGIKPKSPLAQRTEIRHAEGVIAMDEKPSRALRRGQGSSMWNALETVKSGESLGGHLLRQHRRADGAGDAPAAQGARRQPPGHRRALAVAQPRRLQRAARRGRRHPRRRRGSGALRADGRLLRPQCARDRAGPGSGCSTSAPRSTRAGRNCTRRPR